jgi:hypothetical protein
MLTNYGPDANFWYFTRNESNNVVLANVAMFSILGLILLPIYPPKTPEGFGAAYLGIEFISLGVAFILPTQYWLFGFGPLSPPAGMVLMIVGVLIVTVSYRHQRPLIITPRSELDRRFKRSPPVEEVEPDSENVGYKFYYIILFLILLFVIFII